MINLLPPQQKIDLLEEEKYRLTLIFGILILLFLICFALTLFSINIYISGQIEAQKILADFEEAQFEKTQVQDVEKKIESLNKTISNLNSFYKAKISLTKFLERISKTIPPQIYLNVLTLTPPPATEKYIFQVSLSGVSPSREILYQLKKNLEAQEDFKEISLSISSWIEPTDFHLIFKIK